MNKILDKIADLIDVKSIVTLSMTGVMIAMLVGSFNPVDEFKVLFCTSYGCIITFFFTKKKNDEATPAIPVIYEPEDNKNPIGFVIPEVDNESLDPDRG